MSLETQIVTRRLKRIGPLGKVSGLLTASIVAFIGLAIGLEPHIILWRALIASVLMGSLVAFGLSVIHMANAKRQQ